MATFQIKGQDSLQVYTIVDSMPNFPYGMMEFYKFFAQNLEYPQEASDSNIQGKVYVTFVVDSLGQVTESGILKDIGGGCGQEAINVIKLTSGIWNPGIHKGKRVNVRMNLPITFTCLDCGKEDSGYKISTRTKDDPNYYYNLGVAEFNAGRHIIAIFYFTNALENNPKHLDALYNRGISNFEIGKIKAACEDWNFGKKNGDKDVQELIDKYCNK